MPIINLLPYKTPGLNYDETGKLQIQLKENGALQANENGLDLKISDKSGLVVTQYGLSVSSSTPIETIEWTPTESDEHAIRVINNTQYYHYTKTIDNTYMNKFICLTLKKPQNIKNVIYELFISGSTNGEMVDGAEITLFIDDYNNNDFADISTYLVILSSASPMLPAGTPVLPSSIPTLPDSNRYYVGADPHYSMIGLKYISGKGWIATGNCSYPMHTIPSTTEAE